MGLAVVGDDHGGDILQLFEDHAAGFIMIAGVVDGKTLAMAVGEADGRDETQAFA